MSKISKKDIVPGSVSRGPLKSDEEISFTLCLIQHTQVKPVSV